MNFFKEWFSELNPVTKTAASFAIAAIIIFSIGFLSGTSSNIQATLDDPALASRFQQDAGNTAQPTAAPTAAPTEAPTEAPSGENTAPSETPAPSEEANGGESTGSLSTPAEIIAYFNESANKVKTNAKSVTRNWEDLHADNQYLEVPSALEAIGKTLMSTFLKKDETPLVWSTKDDIVANFPVKTQSFVSKTTVDDVAEATCQDDGTYYNITLKFKECTDPVGSGCANAFNVMIADDVYNAASMVQNFSCKYYDSVIECKIEKATGNMVAATYTLPIIMNVTAKVIVTLDAQVGMTFIDDYTIAY